MRGYQKLIALLASLSIIAFSVLLFLQSIVNISVRKDKYKFNSSQVRYQIKVYRNQYGIPMIDAQNEDDMFFASGYVQAEDRMWQMDILRRTAMGRLSEIFGEKTIEYDKFIKTVGLAEISKRIYNSLSPESKKILTNYSNGINEYLRVNKNRLSFEFGALDYFPDKWEPYHSILILRLVSFELSQGFRTEPIFAEIAGKIGYEKAKQLIPNYKDQKTVFEKNNQPLSTLNTDKIERREFSRQNSDLFQKFSQDYFSALGILGVKGSSTGSNVWIYSGDNDSLKKPILACDPHFSLGIPPKWYQMQMSAPGIELAGATLPGIPLIIIGRNKNMAWGFANSMIDDCDLFAEETDSTDNFIKNQSTGKFEKIKYRVDTVKIKNKPGLAFYIKSANRSNIISDISLLEQNIADHSIPSTRQDNTHTGLSLTFNWIGSQNSDEIKFLYHLAKSSSVNEIKYNSNNWKSPALVMLAVDKSGTMIKTVLGNAPLRKNANTSFFPSKASPTDSDWDGVTNLSEVYVEISNSQKFFAAANNKLAEADNLHGFWEPDARFERTTSLLQLVNSYSVRDAQLMQNDIISEYSKKMLSAVIPIIEKYTKLLTDSTEKICFDKLKSWDYLMSAQSMEASVYNAFIERLVYNTFHDELGDNLYNRFTFTESLPLIKIMEEIYSNSGFDFWDNVNTNEKENKDFIIFQSFKDAVSLLKKKFPGEKPRYWNYGKIHQLNLKHVLSGNKLFKPGVTIEDIPLAGNSTTINNNEWKFSNPFEVQVGASLRFIAQLGDSVIYSSLPGGASGDVMNPNFSDQLQIWANGGYLKIPISNANEKSEELRIVIKPK